MATLCQRQGWHKMNVGTQLSGAQLCSAATETERIVSFCQPRFDITACICVDLFRGACKPESFGKHKTVSVDLLAFEQKHVCCQTQILHFDVLNPLCGTPGSFTFTLNTSAAPVRAFVNFFSFLSFLLPFLRCNNHTNTHFHFVLLLTVWKLQQSRNLPTYPIIFIRQMTN